jgi:uncharacterized protein YbjT (DUF2867 family)
MKILIIGASQGTGALAVNEALERGHAVTAFARTPERIAALHPHLSLFKGNFHDAASVQAAVLGQNAVIITASASSLKGFKENPYYFSQGTSFVIEAMKLHGVQRLIVLSAFGVGESRKNAGFLLEKLFISGLLKAPFLDHERQELAVKQSGLDWVIARPGRLSNRAGHKRYQKEVGSKPVPKSIARADVADFLVDAATVDTWLGQAVQIGG